MTEHFNGLTPAQAERLAILAEECAEVIQVVGKILRHGYDSVHPESGESNVEALTKEVSDVIAATSLIQIFGDVDFETGLEERLYAKVQRLKQYTHHQEFGDENLG